MKSDQYPEFVVLDPLVATYSTLNQKIFIYIDLSGKTSIIAQEIKKIEKIKVCSSMIEAKQFLNKPFIKESKFLDILLITYERDLKEILSVFRNDFTEICSIKKSYISKSEERSISKFNKVYTINDCAELIKKINCKLYLKLPNYTIFVPDEKKKINKLKMNLIWMLGKQNVKEAKEDFLRFARNSDQILNQGENQFYSFKKFQEEFRKDDFDENNGQNILRWYSSESFLYRLLNKSLRIFKKPTQFAHIRYVFKILCQAILFRYCGDMKKGKQAFVCYRGIHFSDKELQELKQLQGSVIQMDGFLSTTLNKDIANSYGNHILEIKVPEINVLSDSGFNFYGFANISQYSLFPEQEQIIFTPWNKFRVISVSINQNNNFNQVLVELQYIDITRLELKLEEDLLEKQKMLLEEVKNQRNLIHFIKNQGDSLFLGDFFAETEDYYKKYLKFLSLKYKQRYPHFQTHFQLDQKKNWELMRVSTILQFASKDDFQFVLEHFIWDPICTQIFYKLIVIYSNTGRFDDSSDLINIFMAAIEKKSQFLTPLEEDQKMQIQKTDALNEFKKGNIEKAIVIYQKIQKNFKKKDNYYYPQIMFEIGCLHSKLGNYSEAIHELKASMKIYLGRYNLNHDFCIKTLLEILDVYTNFGQIKESLKICSVIKENISKWNPNYLIFMINQGELLLKMKKYKQVQQNIDEIQKITSSKGFYNISFKLLFLKIKLNLAEKSYEKVLELLEIDLTKNLNKFKITPKYLQWIQSLTYYGEYHYYNSNLDQAQQYIQTASILLKIFHPNEEKLKIRILRLLIDIFVIKNKYVELNQKFREFLSFVDERIKKNNLPTLIWPIQNKEMIQQREIMNKKVFLTFLKIFLPNFTEQFQRSKNRSLFEKEFIQIFRAVKNSEQVEQSIEKQNYLIQLYFFCDLDDENQRINNILQKISMNQFNSLHQYIQRYVTVIKNQSESESKLVKLLHELFSQNYLNKWNVSKFISVVSNEQQITILQQKIPKLQFWKAKALILIHSFLLIHKQLIGFKKLKKYFEKFLSISQTLPRHKKYDKIFASLLLFYKFRQIYRRKKVLSKSKKKFVKIFFILMSKTRKNHKLYPFMNLMMKKGINRSRLLKPDSIFVRKINQRIKKVAQIEQIRKND